MESNIIKFPTIPKDPSVCFPVYLEPMIGSGERITILIVMIIKEEEGIIHKIIDDKRLILMFGLKLYRNIKSLIDITYKSIWVHLEDIGINMESYIPPMDGIFIGDPIQMYLDDEDMLLKQLVSRYSVFAAESMYITGRDK